MRLNKGSVLQKGKYTIESVLGQGSFGITYLATTKFQGPLGDISVKVAVKEFFARDLNLRHPDGTVAEVSSGSLSGKYAKDFQREAKNLSSLKHPNIINVLEAFSENNTHYYVMEYLDGGNLDDYIQSKGRLSESEALDIASQMASALSYMHSHNMLHLDLKPRNVMRCSDGTVCLIDFGLSKQYASSGEPESSTTIGLGTPGYAPLEQGSSDERKNFVPTLDIYALGASVFKMLTGKTPPRASDIMNDGFPSEELEALGIRSETIQMIERMMSPRKKDRPQSVAECGLQVKEVISDKEVAPAVEDTEILEEETEVLQEAEVLQKTEVLKETEESVQDNKVKKKNRLAYLIGLGVIVMLGLIVSSIFDSVSKSEQQSKIAVANDILSRMGLEYPMVYVDGGLFLMGSDSEDSCKDERPSHIVFLDGYWIGKYEVTQDLWEAVMGGNPSENIIDGDRKPVEHVSWHDCQLFIDKLNSLTGLEFKLPTEAQWEFAARGGDRSKGHRYSGSNSIDDVAWYGEYATSDVGTKSPNELGIYDMSGNVYEWCNDWFDYYGRRPEVNPVGPSERYCRIFRGGSIGWEDEYQTVSRRGYAYPRYESRRLGLRLCLKF